MALNWFFPGDDCLCRRRPCGVRPSPALRPDNSQELRAFHLAVVEALAAGDELTAIRLCSGFRDSLDGWKRPDLT